MCQPRPYSLAVNKAEFSRGHEIVVERNKSVTIQNSVVVSAVKEIECCAGKPWGEVTCLRVLGKASEEVIFF